MGEVSDEEKMRIVSEYLLRAPPGEFNDVFNDIRVLVNNDALLQRGVAHAFQEYNTEQFTPVDMPGKNYKVIISKFNQIDGSHYVDPRSNQVFSFDHMRQVASDPQPHSGAEDPQRAAVDTAFQNYAAEHFPGGVSTTYSHNGAIVACIVANKYNSRNYWNGRWRSQWTIEKGTVKGLLRAQVHYYEDGNVQLQTEKVVEFPGNASNPADILKNVKKAEAEYQQAVNESYSQLSDTTFKALRRALPITRNRLDWNKILSYKVGHELSQK